MTLGEKIKKLRTENKLTQDELAEKLFVTRTAISKWETGKGYPGIDSLKLISTLFGISIDDLISDNDVTSKKLLEEKTARKMYYIAIAFVIIAAIGALLAHSFSSPYFFILCLLGVIGYVIFGILSKPKYKRLESKKLIILYILSRTIVLLVIIAATISSIIQLSK